jgi:hypothetical protein
MHTQRAATTHKTKTITMTKDDDGSFSTEKVRTNLNREPGSIEHVIAVMQRSIEDLQRRLKRAEFERDDLKAQMLGRKRPVWRS